VTSICPSQYLDAPIPMVGIEMLLVICFANDSTTHSITKAKAPEFDIDIASLKILFLSFKFFLES